MEQIIFDHQGRTFTHAANLQQLLRFPSSGQFNNYLVKSRGYVIVSLRNKSIAVHLRPSIVGDRAYAALMYAVADLRPERVFIRYFDTDWRYEIQSTGHAAILRITRLLNLANAQRQPIHRRELCLREGQLSESWQGILNAWERQLATTETNQFIARVDVLTGGRFVTFERDTACGAYRFGDFGKRVPPWARLQLRKQKGTRLEEGHDRAFHRFCSAIFTDVSASRRPKMDQVDALTTWPGFGTLRRRYNRLMLPYIDSANRDWLLSATVEDSSINLRSSAA